MGEPCRARNDAYEDCKVHNYSLALGQEIALQGLMPERGDVVTKCMPPHLLSLFMAFHQVHSCKMAKRHPIYTAQKLSD